MPYLVHTTAWVLCLISPKGMNIAVLVFAIHSS
uniref:Uncharacterized protein n=1 Tax=Rhizophora mucronata TaxID=61149 RepID=A0A2P2NQH0_RHIMU